MNEKQRLESNQVNPADKKSEKDYSKYFQTVYMPPSLKDAKNEEKKKFPITMILQSMNSFMEWDRDVSFISVRTAVK